MSTPSEVWKGIKYNPPLSLCIEIEKIINIDLNIFLKGYYLTNIKKSYSCMRTLALFYVYYINCLTLQAIPVIILPTEIPPGSPDALLLKQMTSHLMPLLNLNHLRYFLRAFFSGEFAARSEFAAGW